MPGGSLKHASATYHSPYGTIKSAWRKRGKGFVYNVTIPANTTATVTLPVKSLDNVKLNGRKLTSQVKVASAGGTDFMLNSGEYKISF